MALPSPHATFTIPSLHDNIELDCRIYYPRRSKGDVNLFGRAFAILAHPYAPLGGSYDDPVIAFAGSVLIEGGICLVTFNFRGASGGAGRTSWSGKGELCDYVSIYAFLLNCMKVVGESEPSTNQAHADENSKPLLILGGYSYGSMITSCLPPIKMVQQILDAAGPDSVEREIQSRAQNVGRELLAYLLLHQGSSSRDGKTSLSPDPQSPPGRQVKLGGYDSESTSRRVSREYSRRSLDADRVRQSIDRARQKFKTRTRSGESVQSVAVSANDASPHPNERTNVEPTIAYLLVSPITGSISGLTTMFSKPAFERRDREGNLKAQDTSPSEEKFIQNPTCFVYGTKDVFASRKKLKSWTDDLHNKANSTFSSYEIEGAGHFWMEAGVSSRLKASIADWLSILATSGGVPEIHSQRDG